MLYDILPPLFFFVAFGGIIVVVSRVVLRIRREQLSTAIQHSGRRYRQADTVLNPGTKKVKLFRSRLALLPVLMNRTIHQTKDLVASTKRKLKRAEVAADLPAKTASAVSTTISKPTGGWAQSAASSWQRRRSAVASWGKKVSRSIPTTVKIKKPVSDSPAVVIQPDASPSGPTIRLVNKPVEDTAGTIEETPGQTHSPGKITHFLQRTKPESNDSLRRASLALEKGELARVEDILVPYLAKNTQDAQAYMILGQTALQRESWEEAIEIFQQVLKISDKAPGAQASLGHAALESGHLILALESLQRAHNTEPSNIQVLEDLLTIAERQDNIVLKKSVGGQLQKLKDHQQKKAERSAHKAPAAIVKQTT